MRSPSRPRLPPRPPAAAWRPAGGPGRLCLPPHPGGGRGHGRGPATAMVGFVATSNVAAARRFGLPAAGTMAHSFIEAFEDERAAFRAFAGEFPDRATFLVDTYDTLGGVRAAIEVIGELGLRERLGIRIDSGDLAELAVTTRQLLDQAGLEQVRIFASGGLDEHAIADLAARRAPIDAYGVGTKVGVSADAPYLDTAYKLVAYAGRPVMKLSPGKITAPGPKQVFRGPLSEGDIVGVRDEPVPTGHEPLLMPVMLGGQPTGANADLAAAQARFEDDLGRLPATARALQDARPPPVRLSKQLEGLRERVRAQLPHRDRPARP